MFRGWLIFFWTHDSGVTDSMRLMGSICAKYNIEKVHLTPYPVLESLNINIEYIVNNVTNITAEGI